MGATDIQRPGLHPPEVSRRSNSTDRRWRTHGIQTWESPATADGRKLGPTVTTGTLSNETVHLKDTPEC